MNYQLGKGDRILFTLSKSTFVAIGLGVLLSLMLIAGLFLFGGQALRLSLATTIQNGWLLFTGLADLVLLFALMLILGMMSRAMLTWLDRKVEPEKDFNWLQLMIMGLPMIFILGLMQIPFFLAIIENPVSKEILRAIWFQVGPFETPPPLWAAYGVIVAGVGFLIQAGL